MLAKYNVNTLSNSSAQTNYLIMIIIIIIITFI